ncbi:hypothetical protein EV02_0845 [Prochlorococcus marinus str. SB]|uniref:Uncharacterized protein n=1 Tax=Prochlorococcus marinus str. SB TaxID=59926 RepID=A0A0A2B4U6_PROMR|nr:hypothetical protein EV02_0845 [Prochlorococcus marinus str. SB]
MILKKRQSGSLAFVSTKISSKRAMHWSIFPSLIVKWGWIETMVVSRDINL